MKTFYKPQQHDTAAAVADGYDNNFQTLDTAKAEAGATAAALAGKVDKVEGHDLMTAEERVKLAGIAEGANAYSLPAASATTLGGVKVGNNLTIRPDGTLDAQAGGSGGGNSILVLPYVAPEKDADGNITNSAAFVAAWGAILSRHIAAPDQSALYMEIDGADGMMLRTPCTLLNMGGDADTVQWLISGFAVVNIPASAESSASCKTTVMVAVVCDVAGEMQSVAMYASTGLVGPDGQPNLLGGDSAVVINLSNVDINDPAQLKAAFNPAITSLLGNMAQPIYIIETGNDGSQIPAFCLRSSDSIVIWSFMVHNYVAEEPGDNLAASVVRYWCTLADGQLQSVTCKLSSGWLVTMDMLTDMSFEPIQQIEDTNKLVISGTEYYRSPRSITVKQLSDYVRTQVPNVGENLLLESRGPWVRHSMGDLRVYPFSTGFLTQGETYVFSYVDECTAPAFPTFHLLTRNGPDIIQQIQPGVPFVATRTDWEYILVRKGNEGGICTVSRLKVERGTKVTPWACAPVEAGSLMPSLDEQLVPGEFWMDVSGANRQVYSRTFRGTLPTASPVLLSGVNAVQIVQGYMVQQNIHHMPFNAVHYHEHISILSEALRYLATVYVSNGNLMITYHPDGVVPGSSYVITVKYTKS